MSTKNNDTSVSNGFFSTQVPTNAQAATGAPDGTRVVNCADMESINAARAEVYADVIKGMTGELEVMKEAVAKGDHKAFLAAILTVCENTDYIAHKLGEFITKRALYEYGAAGGKMPTSREESLKLALRLFPSHKECGGVTPDPAVVASETPATSKAEVN